VGETVAEMVAQLLPPANRIAYSPAEQARVLGVSQLVAGAVSALAGGDAQAAITTARVAVENNAFKPLIVGLAWLADRGLTAYQASQDLAAIRDGSKTVEQVAQERGEEYVVNVILGNLGRVGVRAVKEGGLWVQSRADDAAQRLNQSQRQQAESIQAPGLTEAEKRVTVFKTGHYASRLEAAGVNVARAESAVAKEVAAMRPNMATSTDVAGRLHVDNVLVEYRTRMLPDGSVIVGTIFPVR